MITFLSLGIHCMPQYQYFNINPYTLYEDNSSQNDIFLFSFFYGTFAKQFAQIQSESQTPIR